MLGGKGSDRAGIDDACIIEVARVREQPPQDLGAALFYLQIGSGDKIKNI